MKALQIGEIYKRGNETLKVVSLYDDGDAVAVKWIKTRQQWSKAEQTLYARTLISG